MLISLLSFVCGAKVVQGNPFMEMADKQYKDYIWDFKKETENLNTLDSIEAYEIISQVDEVAKKNRKMDWQLAG